MKLIDILVQELPKRGGWPDGVEEIWQDYDRLMRPLGWFHDDLCEDHRRQHCDAEVKVNQRQYEAALSASKKPEWNGEGLPPVGCECEMAWSEAEFAPCKILFIGDSVVLVKREKREDCYTISTVKFRPVRSEADRKRDAAIQALDKSYRSCPHSDAVGEAIYQDIAAGKIPGIRIE